MRFIARLVTVLLVSATFARSAEPVTKQFLRYVYGEEGIVVSDICHHSDDIWMLRGDRNAEALSVLRGWEIPSKSTGVTSGSIGTHIYFIETRDGKVDPTFNLDSIHVLHRQLVLHFLYAALSNDRATLMRLVTDASKVTVDGPVAPPGETAQLGSILGMLPVVRSSDPAEDAKRKKITYRVPVGEEILSLTLVKKGSTWKIDTTKDITVPLEFFHR